LKISANIFRASIRLSPGAEKGAIGAGLVNASMRSVAAMAVTSAFVILGTSQSFGKKSIALAIHSEFALLM